MSAPRTGAPWDEGTVVIGEGGVPTPADDWRGTFLQPRLVLRASTIEEVAPLVARVEAETRAGAWGVLVLAYEAAPACDPAFRVRPGRIPLAWAAVYDGPCDPSRRATPHGWPACDAEAGQVVADPDWASAIDAEAFAARVGTVQSHIAAGDTYQANLTFPLHAALSVEEAWPWYVAARQRARAPYAAWVAMDGQVVMSLSPELFFARKGTRVVTRPMKGTEARGRWPDEDAAARVALVSSEKARAENVMIVDLLRNDLGRVADVGTVRVTDLCAVEAYPTVWQLTSTIEGQVSRDRSLWDVLRALYPCGSITGAPKVRTMALLADCETSPRGVYTGAIGLLRPGGDAVFSVPIRTVAVDTAAGTATLGVGAGITADSSAADEYAECLLKARFARPDPVQSVAGLFETLRLEDGAFWLRDRHLARLQASADRLCLSCDIASASDALDTAAAMHPAGIWRARLVLDRTGGVSCTVSPHADDARVWRVAFARLDAAATDLRLFHKTLDRTLYTSARGMRDDVDDVLLVSDAGAVTESTIANLVVELDGARVTPPVRAGLLPGTFRAELLARGDIRERPLTKDDVRRASRFWLVNSLRGWVEARLSE